MNISSSSRQLLRCLSSSASPHLPRAPPRTSRPPVSIAHLFAAPEETIVPVTLKEIREETEASNKKELTTWKPPIYVRRPLEQTDRALPEIFDYKPQSGTPRNRQDPGTQDSPLEPQLEVETSPKPRRKFPSAEELAVPLYRDALSLRWETRPPTADQLKATERFFLKYHPKFLWSADKFKTIDYGNVPEV